MTNTSDYKSHLATLVQCPHQSIRHSLVEWGSSLSYLYSTSYIRDLINVLPINWYLWCEHIILLPGGDIPWHCETRWPLRMLSRDHSPSHSWHNGVTIRHRVAADNTDTITAQSSVIRVYNIHTYTRSYHCVGVCTVILLCVKIRNVLPRTMN